jgi:hypothetical protein
MSAGSVLDRDATKIEAGAPWRHRMRNLIPMTREHHDREVIVTDSGSGSGMGVILGVIIVLLVILAV